jgi:hypothetical protein
MPQTDGQPVAPPTQQLVTISTPYYAYFALHGMVSVFAPLYIWLVLLELNMLNVRQVQYLRLVCILVAIAALSVSYVNLRRKLSQAIANSLCAQGPYRAAKVNLRLTNFEADMIPSDESATESTSVQYGRLEALGVGTLIEEDGHIILRWQRAYLATPIMLE